MSARQVRRTPVAAQRRAARPVIAPLRRPQCKTLDDRTVSASKAACLAQATAQMLHVESGYSLCPGMSLNEIANATRPACGTGGGDGSVPWRFERFGGGTAAILHPR